MNPTPDSLTGCLLGLALGDAVGALVEAAPAEEAERYVREGLRRSRRPAEWPVDRAAERFGQYTDDTQLARELVATWAEGRGFDPAAFARRLAGLVERRALVGAGPGSTAAGRRLLEGAPWWEAGAAPEYHGNGSAMRAAPLGLLADDPDELVRIVAEQSLVTHRSRRSAAAAVAIAGAARLAAAEARIDPAALVAQAQELAGRVDEGIATVLGLVPGLLPLPTAEAARRLLQARIDPRYPAAGSGRWIGVTSDAALSVVWSLFAFLGAPEDPWEAICRAIEGGGDTDSTAAMAGALAGARHGVAKLPRELLERIHDDGAWRAPELERLAREALEAR
ncbi:MAG TPA: ADP-ribosylglycohydrolase family protein [Gemmatimonadales bacterium]|nr:ADP-ribosylglycohydrolase family protein [Gemmatimonadales bacterium]